MDNLLPEWMLGSTLILGLIVALIAMLKGKPTQKPTPTTHKPNEYDDESPTDDDADTLDLATGATDHTLDDLAKSNAELRTRLDKLQ